MFHNPKSRWHKFQSFLTRETFGFEIKPSTLLILSVTWVFLALFIVFCSFSVSATVLNTCIYIDITLPHPCFHIAITQAPIVLSCTVKYGWTLWQMNHAAQTSRNRSRHACYSNLPCGLHREGLNIGVNWIWKKIALVFGSDFSAH